MDEGLWLGSVVLLAITGILCVAGVLSEAYNDTLWQRAGLALLSFGCFGHVTSLLESHYVPWDRFLLHLGMFIFAVSTAVKCYGFHVKEKMQSYARLRGLR
jgi:hypothetical protein